MTSTHDIVPGILLILGKVSSTYYNQSYNGYTFFLPDTGKERSDGKLTQLEQLSFPEAQQWCEEHIVGLTLATIPNKSIQSNISDFLQNAVTMMYTVIGRKSNFRVNGRCHLPGAWHWINGHKKGGIHRFLSLKINC